MSDPSEMFDGAADDVVPDSEYVERRLKAIDERMARRKVDPPTQLSPSSSDDDA